MEVARSRPHVPSIDDAEMTEISLAQQAKVFSRPPSAELMILGFIIDGDGAMRGFGSIMIERGLARELDARVTLDWAPEGLFFAVEMPLPGNGAAGIGTR